jgi:catechol 2,3-dioxygenase-like lactoylglutathione lyase family enzyme
MTYQIMQARAAQLGGPAGGTMKRIKSALTAVITVAVVFGLRAPVATQGSATPGAAPLAGGRVTHIGVVVKDMDAALREYVRVMGFAMPKVNSYPQPVPGGKTANYKVATVYMPNFFIEIIQPVNAEGPYHEHLQAHGQSIQHIGVAIPGEGSVDDQRTALEQAGGRWSLGPKGGFYAYVNFYPTLGTAIEVIREKMAQAPTPPPAATDPLPPLGALRVTHVGFAATDTASVVGNFTKLFGVPAPKVNEYKDSQYPPDSKWNRSAYLRLAQWNQGGIGMEFIESVGGPTPWSDYVARQKGTAAQHVAINVGNNIDEMIRDLQAKGGKWTNGKPGGGYAYLDFMDTLGLIFELNGTSKSAPAPAAK